MTALQLHRRIVKLAAGALALASASIRKGGDGFHYAISTHRPSVEDASAGEVLIALIREIGRRIEAQRETMLAMMREFFHTPEAIVHSHEKERALPDLIENLVRRGFETPISRPGLSR